jgi:hypothetical protein
VLVRIIGVSVKLVTAPRNFDMISLSKRKENWMKKKISLPLKYEFFGEMHAN